MDNIVEGLLNIFQRGGVLLIPIFIVAQLAWILVLDQWWFLRRSRKNLKRFWKKAPKENWGAFLKNYPGRDLIGGLSRGLHAFLNKGEKALVYKAGEVLHGETPRLQKHLNSILILAYSAPLLGLLGTVAGMIATFKIITQYGIGNPAMMAEGISQALLTTQAGLVVSFPLMLIHNHLLSLADSLETEGIRSANQLIQTLR